MSCQIGELGWVNLPGENLRFARSLPFQNGAQNCEDEPDDGQQRADKCDVCECARFGIAAWTIHFHILEKASAKITIVRNG